MSSPAPCRLVVCDLDGTLLTPEHRLGDYSRSVLTRLRARGVEIMLASGRHFQDIRLLSEALGGNGCLISSNGAAVHDHQARLLQRSPIDPECVRFLIGDPVFRAVHVNVYRSEDWLVERPEPDLLRYHRDSGFHYQIADLDALVPDDVLKVFYYGEPSELKRLETLIAERIGDRVSTTFSLPVTLEVMAAGVSKGAALAHVVERMGIALSEVIAFGDGMNDRELLSLAGIGILMTNADPRLKDALPHLEQIGSNREESVARYLEARFGIDH
ncbi:Cof-type HAD-IIB family hydrolase [Thiocapsa bogorovii]|uniref:Cof-type HAD-IIB family hydrolase n=1 Tax=Thiocapsa bogorovii TaxID=521689 RepID=UPI001E628052|nr:Cof-type HAD-IIB family hydrolase [Thiocapsa bogorovii]UHD18738.1 Cof-type HAD-IIB family hydrolase [Thiocapsa bogorovii]